MNRVEDFIDAAALVHVRDPNARFVIVGGPDAFMPLYAEALQRRAAESGLCNALSLLDDLSDVPALLQAMDVLVLPPRGEGMLQAISDAGAAALPVIATADNGSTQQIEDGGRQACLLRRKRLRPLPRRSSGWPATRRCATGAGGALRRTVAYLQRRRRRSAVGGALQDGAGRAGTRHRAFAVRKLCPRRVRVLTHMLRHGRRLDLLEATHHAANAAVDYAQLASHTIRTVRDGLRWHLIETAHGHYDWSSSCPCSAPRTPRVRK